MKFLKPKYFLFDVNFKLYIVKHIFDKYQKIKIPRNGYVLPYIGHLSTICNNSEVAFLTVDGINGTDKYSVDEANVKIKELYGSDILLKKINIYDENVNFQNYLEECFNKLFLVAGSEKLTIDEENTIKSLQKRLLKK